MLGAGLGPVAGAGRAGPPAGPGSRSSGTADRKAGPTCSPAKKSALGLDERAEVGLFGDPLVARTPRRDRGRRSAITVLRSLARRAGPRSMARSWRASGAPRRRPDRTGPDAPLVPAKIRSTHGLDGERTWRLEPGPSKSSEGRTRAGSSRSKAGEVVLGNAPGDRPAGSTWPPRRGPRPGGWRLGTPRWSARTDHPGRPRPGKPRRDVRQPPADLAGPGSGRSGPAT